MCHHRLWPAPTSVSHPFSSLSSSLGLAGGKYYQKITIPIFRLVLQHFPLPHVPGCFPDIIFCCYLFSLLSSGWFVIAVCGCISAREQVLKVLMSLWTDVELSPMISQLNGCPFLFLFIIFFLKLIVASRLCVIYVKEDDNSNVQVMITWLIWITWTSLSAVWKRAVKLNYSLTHLWSDPERTAQINVYMGPVGPWKLAQCYQLTRLGPWHLPVTCQTEYIIYPSRRWALKLVRQIVLEAERLSAALVFLIVRCFAIFVSWKKVQGPVSIIEAVFPCMGISFITIRQSCVMRWQSGCVWWVSM